MSYELYQCAINDSEFIGEKDDCAVIATSIATGIDYKVMHALFKDHGRVDGEPTMNYLIEEVLHRTQHVNLDFDDYESKTLRTIGKELNKGTFLVFVRRHVLCLKDGMIFDWANDRKFQIRFIWKIVDCS